MSKKLIKLIVTIIVVLAIIIYIVRQKQEYNFFQSRKFEISQYLLDDLIRHYYGLNYHISNNFVDIFESSHDFFRIFDYSEDIDEALKYLKENKNDLTIINFPDHDSIIIYKPVKYFSHEINRHKPIKPDSIRFVSYLFAPHIPIIIATISYHDIHICRFPLTEYLSFKDGIRFRTEEFDSIIKVFHNAFHEKLNEKFPDLGNANLLFRFWHDSSADMWVGEVVCNNSSIEMKTIEIVKEDVINEITAHNFKNYADSLIYPVFFRPK